MSSLRDGRHVDGVRDEIALERGRDLLGDDHARPVLGLLGRRGEVRRDDDVVQLEQRSRVRLAGEDVERGAGDLPGLERVEQRILVDELAARGVDDADARPWLRSSALRSTTARVSSVSGRCSETTSDDAKTASCDAAPSTPSSRKRSRETNGSNAITRMPSASARRATCCPIRPKPSRPERLARQLLPGVARALPAARLHGRVRLRDVPPEREQEPDRVLGGRDDGRLRRVDDEDALPRRGLDVDVVDAHAGAADHAEPLGPLEQRRVELRPRADDDRVVVADDVLERRVEVDIDVEAGAQELDAGLRDRLPDEDPRHTKLVRARAPTRHA